MFAFLGEVPLEILQVHGLELRDSWGYAEHGVIDGRPRLQFTGRGLRQVTLDFRLRLEHDDPESLLDRLRALADAGDAARLQRGDGRDLGDFVILQLSDKPGFAYADGKPVAVQAQAKLKEFAGPIEARRPQRQAAAGSPLARRADPADAPAGQPGDVAGDTIVRR